MALDDLSELELADHWIGSMEHLPRGAERFVQSADVLRMAKVAGEPPGRIAAGLAPGATASVYVGVQATMLVALSKKVKEVLSKPAVPPTPPSVPPTA